MPDFEVRGANARILGDTAGINFSPLVSLEERLGWEAYAQENIDQCLLLPLMRGDLL